MLGIPTASGAARTATERRTTRRNTPIGGAGGPPAAVAGRARINHSALRQWSATGSVQLAGSVSGGGHQRRYRLGRWRSRRTSSWNPPETVAAEEQTGASRSRRSLVSVDIGNKPGMSRRSSTASSYAASADGSEYGMPEHGSLAEMLLREDDGIWNNSQYRFTFYSPATGTVRATDVQTLRTDSAQGLGELMQQALDGKDGAAGDCQALECEAAPRAAKAPPQLSVTSVDSEPDDVPAQAPDSGFLHPNYTRAQPRKRRGRRAAADWTKQGPVARGAGAGPLDGAGQTRLFWLDVVDPTDSEITALAQIFGLHSLTTEELLQISEQTLAQDSFKSFRHYDIICYRTSSAATTPTATPVAGQEVAGSTASLGAASRASSGFNEKAGETVHSTGYYAEQTPPPATDSVQPTLWQRLRAMAARRWEHAGGAAVPAVSISADDRDNWADDASDEPVAFYAIVLDEGVITLHSGNVAHVRNTIGRLRMDEEAMRLTPFYIAYLLLEDITDTLVPTTRLLEMEVDTIDEIVLILTRAEHDDVLKRIGTERRHALWLVRLLHGKAEVLRALERHVQAKAVGGSSNSSAVLGQFVQSDSEPLPAVVLPPESESDSEDAGASQLLTSDEEEGDLYGGTRRAAAPEGRQEARDGAGPDVGRSLADVHDRLVSLTASVHHCERILARAHGNYLARINLELTHASNTTNQLATQMTVLAGLFLPLNLIAGIFGMNVKVPGRDRDDLRDFGLIVGAMGLFVILTLAFCRWRRII
ncbi:CorA metal ion transporter [Coemansia guatemalensis]|uniref:CorA metal ion transporter n=1 Tax=Coemansia guatemalensis TaxID=2761395 RepID=A0A9W8HTE3_9FUNG|nr:CorA metal ion transporter [Coemansia guatemalensis]